MHVMRGNVVDVPACHKRAKRAKRANVSLNVPTSQKCANFLTWRASVPKGGLIFQLCLQKGVPNFHLFLKRNFNF